MRLSDFLDAAPRGQHKIVEFAVIGPSMAKAVARAAFCYVGEADRQRALRDARVHLSSQFKGEIPPDHLTIEETYQVLHIALRDVDDASHPFAESVVQLRNALTLPVAVRLDRAFWQWMGEEFPDTITAKKLDGMKKEAEGNS